MPQQAHLIIHQTIEKTIKPPIIIAAMTGHLQYVAAIQFDHELKESFTLVTSPVIDLFLKKLSTNISPIPLLLLHSIAVVICGIVKCDVGTQQILEVGTCLWVAAWSDLILKFVECDNLNCVSQVRSTFGWHKICCRLVVPVIC